MNHGFMQSGLNIMEENKTNYIKRISETYTRKELLQSCRMIGISAHKLKTKEEIAALLYDAKIKNEK